jgi:hypothetical protein
VSIFRTESRSKWLAAAFMAFFLMFGMAQIAAAEDFALGDIPLHRETYEKYIKRPSNYRLDAVLPTSYDARNDGIVTPAKNQGTCGVTILSKLPFHAASRTGPIYLSTKLAVSGTGMF